MRPWRCSAIMRASGTRLRRMLSILHGAAVLAQDLEQAARLGLVVAVEVARPWRGSVDHALLYHCLAACGGRTVRVYDIGHLNRTRFRNARSSLAHGAGTSLAGCPGMR